MTWDSLAHLYAPTYFQLLKDSRRDPRPYTELKRARFIKGKKSQGVPATDDGEMEWKREKEWLQGVVGGCDTSFFSSSLERPSLRTRARLVCRGEGGAVSLVRIPSSCQREDSSVG
jgi:hypothetical protein